MLRRWICPTITLTLVTIVIAGCANQRRIVVTSDPPGARVWLNDQEIGVTPTEAAFKFYGTYAVRLDKDGYEPLVTERKASAPIHEYPGLDLIATAIPYRFTDRQEWHFELEPAFETTQQEPELEADLRERAIELRDRLLADDVAAENTAAEGDASDLSGN